MKFSYLFNTLTLQNDEFTEKVKKILDYFEKIAELNVDTIAISLPFLAESIKKYFPHMNMIMFRY